MIEIPAEAVKAGVDALDAASCEPGCTGCPICVEAAITAALPHLVEPMYASFTARLVQEMTATAPGAHLIAEDLAEPKTYDPDSHAFAWGPNGQESTP